MSDATYGRRLGLGSIALVAVLLAAYAAIDLGSAEASAIVAIPYVVLVLAGRRAKPWGLAVVCGLLLAGTGFGLWSASSSSTGGLAFLWLCPLQILIAATVSADLFHADEDL